MKHRFSASVVLVALSAALGTAQPTDPLRATHDALFATFIPIRENASKPALAGAFAQARDGIWNAASKAPAFQELLTPFADLRAFGAECGMAEFVETTQQPLFSRLAPQQQARAIYLLQTCSSNTPRRLAMSARNFYIRETYGALQEALTGVKLNLFAPDSFVKEHTPRLPESRLRYDAAKKEIARADGEIDYLIVGSGPAGSVLAHELRRGGKRVVLVERGPLTVPGAMETRLVDGLKEDGGTRSSTDGAMFIRNGNAVGGGSLVNVDLCFAPTLPSVKFKIDQWRKEGRIGANDFTPAELEKAYAWVKQAIGTRVLSESEINPNNRTLYDGAKALGLTPKLYDLNTYPPGKSPYAVTDKRSSATELVFKALNDAQNPLSLLPDAEVRRVLFDGSMKAHGVELVVRKSFDAPGVIADPNRLAISPGTTITIRAKQVILSAGALGSPTILLRSGVKNDQIGRGAVTHASMPTLGLFDKTIDALSGTQASVFVDDRLIPDGFALEAMSAEPLYAALMSPGPALHSFEMLQSYRNLAGFGTMLVDTPSPANRVFLDANGDPQVEYTLSEADKVRFRRGIATAVRAMFHAGAKKVFLPTTEDLLGNSDGVLRPVILTDIKQADAVEKNLQFIPNRSIITSAHLQATNKMGASAANSVVSREFKVWGTEGLYVVDGSVFPTSIGANPMQSIYTFAKIFADRMSK
ncbi:MAG TPA: GMC family oxidoreductase [Bryobacteraceae bacterium]|jgi:choline dehydrogenase-like flavoprotein|nr:GMC family oxidoreductase [Bryobacteraceae bacterium]